MVFNSAETLDQSQTLLNMITGLETLHSILNTCSLYPYEASSTCYKEYVRDGSRETIYISFHYVEPYALSRNDTGYALRHWVGSQSAAVTAKSYSGMMSTTNFFKEGGRKIGKFINHS